MFNKIIIVIIAVTVIIMGGYLLLRNQSSSETTLDSPESAAQEPTTPESPPADQNIVVYTDSGYSPNALTVKTGTTVTFKNESSKSMWPASAMHPSHRVYSGTALDEHCPDAQGTAFDACAGILPGNSWPFRFDKTGEWKYHDHLNPSYFGAIVVEQYSGTVLAGESAPLLDFAKTDYDAAVKSDKLVVLYFYANWCPICKVEFPVMQKAFNELTTDKVIGFRVNYNDDQTDDNEKNLAREFGVAYQHTKVFVKNGQRILKSPEGWDDKHYDTEINKALIQ